MHTPIVHERHYSTQINSEVQQICAPLFHKYQMSHFCYLRLHNDGSLFTLITNKDLYLHHLAQEYPVVPVIEQKNIQKNFYYIIMPDLEDGFSQVAFDYRTYFGLNFPIYIFERHKDYFDLYVYGCSGKEEKSINFYLSNLHLLENFKFYFKEKAAALIEKSNKNRIIMPPNMLPNFCGLEPDAPKKSEDFYPQNYFLEVDGQQIALRRKQIQLVKFLSQGYTAKEMAKKMSLSPRTIECYLSELKIKLGLKRKSEMIKRLAEAGLLSN